MVVLVVGWAGGGVVIPLLWRPVIPPCSDILDLLETGTFCVTVFYGSPDYFLIVIVARCCSFLARAAASSAALALFTFCRAILANLRTSLASFTSFLEKNSCVDFLHVNHTSKQIVLAHVDLHTICAASTRYPETGLVYQEPG